MGRAKDKSSRRRIRFSVRTLVMFVTVYSVYAFAVSTHYPGTPTAAAVLQKRQGSEWWAKNAWLHDPLARVSTRDGVDEKEADMIACNYYHGFVGLGCGGAGRPKESGEAWRVPVLLGYGGTYDHDITINKHTGKVSSPNGPTISDPRRIWHHSARMRAERLRDERHSHLLALLLPPAFLPFGLLVVVLVVHWFGRPRSPSATQTTSAAR